MTLLIGLSGSMLFVNLGCAPPPPKIDTARQKAIDDSLKTVAQEKYVFELSKKWSTGYEHHKAKMYRNALTPFWYVAESDTISRYKDVWNKLVDVYFNLGNPDSAQIAAEMGLQHYPDNLFLHRSLAHILTSREMIDAAIEHYAAVVNLDPKAIDDWKKLGGLYLRNDQVDDAINAYETVTEINPNDQEANDILSKLYAQTGNEDAALERLEKVRQQDPNNPKHMFNLGRQYFAREDFGKAEAEFRAYVTKMPDDKVAIEFLASSLQNQEKYQEAINVYESLIKLEPTHKKSMCEIASCLKALKKYKNARDYANKALAIDSQFGLAFIVRGEIYEACVEDCISNRGNDRTTWDDKLVYQLAYDEYSKALKDIAFRDITERRISYVKQLIPTAEDRFMHKSDTKATGPCYNWIY
jgi:tetratricopeptide (TPR) repeat protein